MIIKNKIFPHLKKNCFIYFIIVKNKKIYSNVKKAEFKQRHHYYLQYLCY